jgi:hypothetical protein
LPYHQSFGTSSKDVFWWQEAKGGRWLSSLQAADGDGACLRFVADDSIARGKVCSEKLTLKGAARPMLLFQHSTKPGQNLRLHVLADRQDANGPVLLKTISPDDEKGEAWVQEGIEVTDEIARELIKYYPTWKACDFRNVPEPVIKFALLHFDDIEKNIYPFFKPYDGDKLRVQVTAYVWIDVYRSGLSKGVGVKALQEALGVTPEETVVFGDYLNDIPMAEHAGVSYAVANAHPKLKECFTETIGSNDDESVAKKIIELLR